MDKFIKGIITFSLKNKYLVFFLTAIMAITGIYCFKQTPIEAFPDVTNTRVRIITQWPGRGAEEIEKFITIPIEVEMNAVPKKQNLRSVSLFGLSVVTLIFEDHVDDFYARQQVIGMLSGLNLPEGADMEIEPSSSPTGEIFRYILQSPNRDVRELKVIQDWVVDRSLRSVPGIADIVSFGGEVKSYEIGIDPNTLAEYDLTPLDVFEAVSKSNINVGGDIIEKSNQAYVVRGIGLLTKIKDIENVIIQNREGTPILVKNVATVSEAALPRLGKVGMNHQTDLIEGIVVMRKGENPSEVIQSLKDKIEELNAEELPEDVKIVPFYDRSKLVSYTTNTVLTNLLEGILFVTVLVYIFMADIRTTLIVAVVIPLSLLFAFIMMKMQGMSANLISMGAIDFGIIIDGAVVMMEGIFVVLDRKAHQLGMEKFNKVSKLGVLRKKGIEMGKAIFFSISIIIIALLPILAFQKVEGKMFSPLAFTLGYAMLGALIFSLTLVPALASVMLNKNVREKENFFVRFLHKNYLKIFNKVYQRKTLSISLSVALLAVSIYFSRYLGTEFLPQLNEGAIYVRASLPQSIALTDATKITESIKNDLMEFEEVKIVLSQTGRPNDGTDPTGFFNIEYHIELHPKKEYQKRAFVDKLVERMENKMKAYPGIVFGFSQPIMDNVEEAVSGVKGSIAVKIFGKDVHELEKKADSVYMVLKDIPGITDLGVIPNIGQPEMRIEFDEQKMARYGVAMADAQALIEMAIGGKVVSQFYEDEKKFDIRIRYMPEYRKTEKEIGNILVPTMNDSKTPLKEIASINLITGPSFIYREDNKRHSSVKFSVRGRDLGSTIAEAQEKVNEAIKLPRGMSMVWKGEFENQVRATKRLQEVVPLTLLLIFLMLFTYFGNIKDAVLVLLNVPFALIGGIFALLVTGTNFSISAGVGFIALFGICIQNGVILISVFKKYLSQKQGLDEAIKNGVESRVRPVLMTAMIAALGLLPAALSTGLGSESQKPLAIVIVGGLVTATLLTLLILPLIFERAYRNGNNFKGRKYFSLKPKPKHEEGTAVVTNA